MSNLEKKNIIVTGASGGIGNSIIKKLSEAGANVLASGTRIEKLEELKKNFNNIKILGFDISQHEKIETFINNATEELGGSLDCIVNNAGITKDSQRLLGGDFSIQLTHRPISSKANEYIKKIGLVSSIHNMRAMAKTDKSDRRTLIELKAIDRLLNHKIENTSVSSTKSATGHLLGAAGAIEAIYSILSIKNQIVPPTNNLITPDKEALGFDLVPIKSKKRNVKNVLSNSFGFGGTNASLVISCSD